MAKLLYNQVSNKKGEIIMYVRTSRCLIRPFEEKDLNRFISYRNNLEWMKYQGFKGLTAEDYRKLLLVEPVLQNGAQFAILLLDSSQVIGDIYLKEEDGCLWIGYTIAPDFARQGFAAEVVQAMAAHLKEAGHTAIYAGVEPENIASIKLLEKLGFVFTHTDEYDEKIYRLHLSD
ncbi:GNAT family N-acetyltransferase [uncultured Enterococcus sp.]|uniref:GNAT family N-acetyltransferase n=1 Tax=uncultured Enterococcus sp. TaxID=167972 RepID=UPI002AA62579|nr:GNAT family N-acetyltransferase [uncultured Enterococcus sp.]